MNGYMVYSSDRKPNRIAETQKGAHRKIAQMLVVDGVIFQFVDQFSQIRHFDDDEAILIEQVLASM